MGFIKKQRNRLILLFVFILLATIRSALSDISLPNIAQDTITLSLGVLYEALPFVFLGIILSVTIQQYVPEKFILRILPRLPLFKRATLSASGFLLPVCECGNVPLARGLMIKGLRPQDVITFLLAAPILNPVTVLTTTQAFGSEPRIVIIRVIAAFFIANLIGWVFDRTPNNKMLTPSFISHCNHENTATKRRFNGASAHISSFAFKFREELDKLLPALAGGSFIAGAIQTVIPRTWLLEVSAQPVLAILLMLALAFIVSICANVDAFFALSLSGIFPVSAIIAFLVFGPMIDIKMLALLRTTYTRSTLLWITGLVAVSTFMISLGVHYAL